MGLIKKKEEMKQALKGGPSKEEIEEIVEKYIPRGKISSAEKKEITKQVMKKYGQLQPIKVEKLDKEIVGKIYELRKIGKTTNDILEFLYDQGIGNITRNDLNSFFTRYNLVRATSPFVVENQVAIDMEMRKIDSGRRMAMAMNILEESLDEVRSMQVENVKEATSKAKVITDICKTFLDSSFKIEEAENRRKLGRKDVDMTKVVDVSDIKNKIMETNFEEDEDKETNTE